MTKLLIILGWLVLFCIEHVFGLPLVSLTVAMFFFASAPRPWRGVLWFVSGFVLSIVYLWPFWLGLGAMLALWWLTEWWQPRRYEGVMMLVAVLSVVAAIVVTKHLWLGASTLLGSAISLAVVLGLLLVTMPRRQHG